MDRMEGVGIKIKRGKEHIGEIEAKSKQFLDSNPFQVMVDEEPDSGDLVYRVKILAQPPVEWAAIIGDATHNLRSALDLLVWQLVLANGSTPDRDSAFPVSRTAATFDGTLAKVKGLGKEAKELIRAVKPYRGGNDLLWQLHQLNIVDKHRLLVPVGTAHRNVIIDVAAGLRGLHLEREIPVMHVAVKPGDRQYPLQDGAELFRVMAAARSSADQNLGFTFELAFGEGDVVQGEPLTSTLHRFATTVQEVVDSFRSLLEANPTP